MDSIISIMPFFIAVLIAMLTRQVLAGVVLGLLIGSYALEPGLFNAFSQMSKYIFITISNMENLRIIVFLYVFGGFVGVMQISGGIKGFAKYLEKFVMNEKRALLVCWITIFFTFMDCEFRVMTIGPVMKALKGKLNIVRTKVAYTIDTSTVPVIVLIPVATTYVGYMVSVVGGALEQANIKLPSYQVFLSSIPYNFYAIIIVTIGLYSVVTGRYFGKKLIANPSDSGESEKKSNQHRESIEQEIEMVRAKPWNMILPLAALLLSTFYLIGLDGFSNGATSLLNAVQSTDATEAMLIALLFSTVFAFILCLLSREKLSELMYHFVDGGNQLMMAILLLILVWSMAAMSEDLGFTQFVTKTFGAFLPKMIVPAIVFLFSSLVGYFTGTSWGTWGLLMPISTSLAAATGAYLPLTIGAVFAGGSFGDFTSPLGETTITTATVLDLPVVEYSYAKLPSSLMALAVSMVMFLVAGAFL